MWLATEATATAGAMPTKIRSGVIKNPPPMPNMPDTKPTAIPIARMRKMFTGRSAIGRKICTRSNHHRSGPTNDGPAPGFAALIAHPAYPNRQPHATGNFGIDGQACGSPYCRHRACPGDLVQERGALPSEMAGTSPAMTNEGLSANHLIHSYFC